MTSGASVRLKLNTPAAVGAIRLSKWHRIQPFTPNSAHPPFANAKKTV